MNDAKPRAVRTSALIILGTIAVGCRCNDDDRPYTPFGMASSLSTETPTPNAPDAASAREAAYERRAAEALKPPRAKLSLGELTLSAPDEQLIERALAWQTEGGPAAAVAWLVPKQARADAPPGALFFFQADTPPRRLSEFPSFVPTAEGCAHQVDLVRTGPNTVTLDVAARCEGTELAKRLPTRSLRVLAPEREKAQVFGLRLAPPLAPETLTARVESDDIDGDGHDDVAVSFTLKLEGTEKESSATLSWLDRASGAAREFSEPRKSFEAIGSIETVRAKGANTSARVFERIENARRLMHYICAGNGTPSLTNEEGKAIQCGALEQARSLFVTATAQAYLTRGLQGSALFSYETRNWYGAISSKSEQELRSLLDSNLRRVEARLLALNATPRDPGPGATFSSIAFGAGGSLLVQTGEGVLRYRNGELHDASLEIDPWPLKPIGPKGEALIGVALPCERPRVEVHARSTSGTFSTVARAPWLAPRPGVCSGGPEIWTPVFRPVRWDEGGVAGLLGSSWLGSQRALEAPALGGPVSANGHHWVAVTSLGLFLQHETEVELWRGADVHPKLAHCVVDDTGRRVACPRGSQVLLYETPSSERREAPAP